MHSAGSQGPQEGSSDLVAYLQKELGAEYDVRYPKMPAPENPSYILWKEKLENELRGISGEVILVGHSLGGSVLLKYLSEEPYKVSVAGLFLVAAPYWGKKHWQIEEYLLSEDFASKLSRIPEIFLYHSHGDELVPFAHVKAYAKKLPQAKVRGIDGHEHTFTSGLHILADDIKRLHVNKIKEKI